MENAKQKAIEVAYGTYYLEGNSIDENGWTDSVSPGMLNTIPCDYKSLEIEYKRTSHFYRPISLAGIETNNNWISIHSEDDLPKKRCNCWFIDKEKGFILGEFLNNSKEEIKFILANATHYQIVSEPSKPIY